MRPPAFPQRAPIDKSKKDTEFEELKRKIHGKLVDKLDLSRVSELEGETLKREIRLVVEHLCDLSALPDNDFRFHAAPPMVAGMGTFPVRAYAVIGSPH